MDDATMVLVEVGASHGQGAKDALLAEIGKRLARHAGHHLGCQRITAIRVQVGCARGKVQLLLAKQQAQDLFLRNHVIQPPPRQGESLPLVANAAGVL